MNHLLTRCFNLVLALGVAVFPLARAVAQMKAKPEVLLASASEPTSTNPGNGEKDSRDATLRGRVVNSTGSALEGVTVYDKTSGAQTITDANGSFQLPNLKAGAHSIIFTAFGVEASARTVIVADNEVVVWNVTLNERTHQVAAIDVVVTTNSAAKGLSRLGAGSAESARITAGIKNEVIRIEDLNANLATNVSRQVFAKVPGMQIWESDASGVQINIGSRGLSPNRSWEFNVRQNGYDISSDIFGYPEAYYNPPLEAVRNIEVLRGAASLQYGPQFGGAVNYVLKPAGGTRAINLDQTSTVGSYGLLSNFTRLHGTVGKVDYQAYTHNRLGNGWRTNARFNINNAFGQVNLRLTEKLTLGAELTYMDYINQQAGGLTDAQFEQDARQSFRNRNWFQINWVVPAFTLNYKHNDRLTVNFKTFGLVGQRNSIGFTAAITTPDTANRVTGLMAERTIDRDWYRNWGQETRVGYDFDLFGQRHTLVGGYRTFIGTTRRVSGTGDRGADFNLNLMRPDYNRDLSFVTVNNALFAEVLLRPTSSTRIVPGIRTEFINNTASGRLSYNFSTNTANAIKDISRNRTVVLAGLRLEQDLMEGVELYANASQAFRPALYSDLTPPTTTDSINANLSDATGYNLDLGLRGQYKSWLTWDASVFYLNYGNRIGNLSFVENGVTRVLRTNIGESRNLGFEGFLEVNPVKAFNEEAEYSVSAFTSVMFQNARYADLKTTSVAGGVVTENNLKDRKVENAPDAIHRVGVNFIASKYGSLTWQWNYVGQQFTDANNTDRANAIGTVGALQAYQIQDISLAANLTESVVLRASLNNILDARYATRRAGGYPGPGLLPGEGRNFACSLSIKL